MDGEKAVAVRETNAKFLFYVKFSSLEKRKNLFEDRILGRIVVSIVFYSAQRKMSGK